MLQDAFKLQRKPRSGEPLPAESVETTEGENTELSLIQVSEAKVVEPKLHDFQILKFGGMPLMDPFSTMLTEDRLPPLMWAGFGQLDVTERQDLQKEAKHGVVKEHRNRERVFDAIQLMPPIIQRRQTAQDSEPCVAYGLGIASNAEFEQQVAQLGCEVHLFDCRISPSSPAVTGKNFTFHSWCIGQKDNAAGKDLKLQFKSLPETMQLLSHSHISLLKLNIDGSEWQFFQTEIAKSSNLPDQLAFKLHTQQSKHGLPELLADKDYAAVNNLFLSLHDLGYRTLVKEPNVGDRASADFVVVNVKPRDISDTMI